MSELKEIELGEAYKVFDDDKEFYLKSEADKVIAELEERRKMEVKQLLILNREQAISGNKLRDSMEQALRHQKYKRCLAMAKWCNEKWLVHNFAEIPTKLGFYDKWEKRWLALAEEPTWAKFMQLIRKEAK